MSCAGPPTPASLLPDRRLRRRCRIRVGRVVDAVKALLGAQNTIFIYIADVNGSSAAGGLEGSTNENLFFDGFSETWQHNIKVIDELGDPKHFNHFPFAWRTPWTPGSSGPSK